MKPPLKVMPDEVVFISHDNDAAADVIDGFDPSTTTFQTPLLPPTQFDQCTFERKPGTNVELAAYGFIYPLLTMVVIFTNINGIIVLLRLRNFTQTNMLLFSIFIVDLLTTAIPFPKFFIQFSLALNKPQIPPYPWCYLSSLLFPALPIITNNISIWFVVTLTIQRFTCVWKRTLYDRVFSRTNVLIIIGAITLITTAFHSVLLIDNYRVPLACSSGGRNYTICNEDPQTFLIPGGTALELYVLSSYYLSRIVVFHFIPIAAIAISNLLLIRILMKAEGTRRRLFSKAELTEQRAQEQLDKIDADEEKRNAQRTDSSGSALTVPSRSTRIGSLFTPNENGRKKSWSQAAMSAVSNGTSKLSSGRKMTTATLTSRSIDMGNKAHRISTTTHMLMAISTIYLVQHIFQSILFVSGVALNVLGEPEPEALLRSITVQNLVYWAGFPANFFLCLHVQAPFREMFYSMYSGLKRLQVFKKFWLNTAPPIKFRNRTESLTAMTAAGDQVTVRFGTETNDLQSTHRLSIPKAHNETGLTLLPNRSFDNGGENRPLLKPKGNIIDDPFETPLSGRSPSSPHRSDDIQKDMSPEENPETETSDQFLFQSAVSVRPHDESTRENTDSSEMKSPNVTSPDTEETKESSDVEETERFPPIASEECTDIMSDSMFSDGAVSPIAAKRSITETDEK